MHDVSLEMEQHCDGMYKGREYLIVRRMILSESPRLAPRLSSTLTLRPSSPLSRSVLDTERMRFKSFHHTRGSNPALGSNPGQPPGPGQRPGAAT